MFPKYTKLQNVFKMWLCVDLCLSVGGFRLKSLPKKIKERKKFITRAFMGGAPNSEVEKAELGEKSEKCLMCLFYPHNNPTGWVQL